MEKNTKLEFHVITPYKGPDDWLDECKNSIRMQNSTQNRDFLVFHHVIEDTQNKGACRNHFETLKSIKPFFSDSHNCIIVHLDGDDKLIDYNTFNYLFDVYQNNNVWVTYGNYVSRNGSCCKPLDHLPFRESFAKHGWRWSHLRTFRHFLSEHLLEEDMKDSNGNWFTAAPDVAIILPILELSGHERVKFLDRDFVYYRLHSNNEHSTASKFHEQIRCANEIMRKKPYSKLK
jgi:hypothetical protein